MASKPMDRFLQFSAYYDSEEKFGAHMTAATIVSCAWFFVAAIILTVATLLSPAHHFFMVFWIWWSFGVVAVYSWICSRIAYRKPVSKLFAMQIYFCMWIVWAFSMYAAFYRGIWSVFHPSEHFSFDLHWTNALFTCGG